MAIRAVLGARAGSVAARRSSLEAIGAASGLRVTAISGRPASLVSLSSAFVGSTDSSLFEKGNVLAVIGGCRRVDILRDTRRNTTGRPTVRVDAMSSSASESKPLQIIGIAGSLRKSSTNAGLLRAAVEIVKKDFPDVNLEIVDISNLPFVDTDLEVNGTYPQSVTEFRAKVLAADGVLFACPEYNYSVPAVLKNAVDWASRPPNVWGDKGAAIISAGGGAGGARSSYHLRQSGVYIDLHFINKPEMFVKIFEPPQKFDQEGNLIDEKAKAILREVVKSLRAWIIRIKQ